ncbi:MAG: 3-deoxy-7-phosphoheptulonate synthase class II [Kofleriaceae bacterium]|nr:3-deoxy-7-phosphoheptulonate synthase class II [Myxococcales bacterium]MCB9559220.1 3-deoxy-7-phosphoheptulonate synthase class II [Kofleriaceae bacterium]MCB9574888.1 3-deoxy-7-phosphoheptulonate synthase class II [Kofleriaceae bacterium]
MSDWSPDSWQARVAAQQPVYPDRDALQRAIGEIRALPPLVTSWEIEALRDELGRAARGEAFLLQGGDCAESFDDCRSESIAAKLKILLQMSLVLVHGTRRQVIRVGRIAGQYAKPRSADNETRDGVTLPAYRGDLVNREAFTEEDRTPDPMLMLRAYERAGLTLNFIRALTDGGFADLHHPEYWDISFARDARHAGEYEKIVESIRDAVSFVSRVTGLDAAILKRVELFTSHEGLALHYEAAQTRQVPRRDGWYNLSTHMPWIGMRTAQLDGAHVEFHRGIRNPLGIKIGPAMTAEWLTELLDVLDPDRIPGRITLIARMGAGKVAAGLPPLVEAVRRAGRTPLWVSDPMHGNTETLASGYKTRRFDKIQAEIEESFAIHEELGSTLGGIHFELTGENVTECIGGASGLVEADLERAYRSRVDPRLNYEQALELAMLIARHLRATPVRSR